VVTEFLVIVVLIADMYFKGFGGLECSWARPCSFVETGIGHRGRSVLGFGQGRDLRWLR
jgi:hypothetical protein